MFRLDTYRGLAFAVAGRQDSGEHGGRRKQLSTPSSSINMKQRERAPRTAQDCGTSKPISKDVLPSARPCLWNLSQTAPQLGTSGAHHGARFLFKPPLPMLDVSEAFVFQVCLAFSSSLQLVGTAAFFLSVGQLSACCQTNRQGSL